METLIDVIRPYFEDWGYLIVFGFALLENSAFVGAIIPGDVVLLLAGFYAARSSLHLAPIVALAFVGAIVGDTIGYAIGRFAGRALVERFSKRIFTPERMGLIDRYYEEYGTWSVAIGRLAPVVRVINTFAAGMAKMPFPRFILAVGSVAAVWAIVMPTLGFYFSESLEAVRSTLGWVGVVFLFAFVALIVGTYRRMIRRLTIDPESV